MSKFCQLEHNNSFKRNYLVNTQFNEKRLKNFVEIRVIAYLQFLIFGTIRYLKMRPNKSLLKIL